MATVARAAPPPLSMYYVLTKRVNVKGLSYSTDTYVVTDHPDKFLKAGWKLHKECGAFESEAEGWHALGLLKVVQREISLAIAKERGEY